MEVDEEPRGFGVAEGRRPEPREDGLGMLRRRERGAERGNGLARTVEKLRPLEDVPRQRLGWLGRFAGRDLDMDEAVFASESATAFISPC